MPQCGEAGAVRQVTHRFPNPGFETSPGRIRRTWQPALHTRAGFCFSGRRDTLGTMSTPPDARVHAVPLPAAAERAADHPPGWPFLAGHGALYCELRDGSAPRGMLSWGDVAGLDGFLAALGEAMRADGWHYHTLAPGATQGAVGAWHQGERWRVVNLEPRGATTTVTLVEGRWEHFWPGAPPRD